MTVSSAKVHAFVAFPRILAIALGAALLSTTLAPVAPSASARSLYDPDRGPTITAADESMSFEYFASAALRAYPRFAAMLLEEAGRDGAEFGENAAAEYREYGSGEYWRAHALSLSDHLAYAGTEVVSVLRSRYMDQGGAHPNVDYRSWLWRVGDAERAGGLLGLGDLFVEGGPGDPFVKAWVSALMDEKRRRLGEQENLFEEDIARAAGALAERPFTLAPSTEPGFAGGIVIHHAPYDVGSYAEGGYDVLVPLSAFEGRLSDLGRAVFKGAPAEQP